MGLTLLKLLLTPSLMYLVSKASRRWGSAIGGLLSGMPLTSAPVSIFLAAEQGTAFAAGAAIGSIAGMTATTLFYLTYYLTSRYAGIFITICVSAAVYVASASIFSELSGDNRGVIVFVLLVAVTSILVASARDEPDDRSVETPAWDMAARLTVSAAAVLIITTVAPVLGPTYTGVVAPIPVLAWPLLVFSHAQQGRPAAIMVIRGNVQASIGLLAFFLVVARLVATYTVLAYLLGLLASVGLSLPWFWLALRSKTTD